MKASLEAFDFRELHKKSDLEIVKYGKYLPNKINSLLVHLLLIISKFQKSEAAQNSQRPKSGSSKI
jgi:hypothetical protein